MKKNAMERIAAMTYGVEIEYTGATRGAIAKAIANAIGGHARYEGYHLDNWVVEMPDGRRWQVCSDRSVTGSRTGTGGEVVTPILTMADMETLQTAMRAMRAAGARVNASCGCHVHVGAKGIKPKQIQNLVKSFYHQEELIIRACGVRAARLGWYTRRTDHGFVEKIVKLRNPDMNDLMDAYYYGVSGRHSHYCHARYRTLNLHNLWQGGKRTVEYRLFEGTLHAGEMRANVLLALTLTAYAMDAKCTNGRAKREFNEASGKYDLRVLLLRLGWIGEEFKNPRKHMMKRLGGSTAWKNGRPTAETITETTAA